MQSLRRSSPLRFIKIGPLFFARAGMSSAAAGAAAATSAAAASAFFASDRHKGDHACHDGC